MSKLKNVGEKGGSENGSARFEGCNRRRIGKSPMMGRGGPFPAITSGLPTIRELSRGSANREVEYNHFYDLPVNALR
jgi:hypothetical protein